MGSAKQKYIHILLAIFTFFLLGRVSFILSCQADYTYTENAIFYPHKYEGVLTQAIDKYIVLCVELERLVGLVDLNIARQPVFSHSCVVNCYNDMIAKKSVQPLILLWNAYKKGAITIDKQKFVYELCHLIGIVFEKFLIQLAADFTGQSAQTITELLDKLEIDLPIDDLIDILEQCYYELSVIAEQISQHNITWNKTTIAVILTAIVVIAKLCQYYVKHHAPVAKPITT